VNISVDTNINALMLVYVTITISSVPAERSPAAGARRFGTAAASAPIGAVVAKGKKGALVKKQPCCILAETCPPPTCPPPPETASAVACRLSLSASLPR